MEKYRNIRERVMEEAKYIINTQGTIRMAARRFKVSKSTVHNDFQKRLKEISPSLYKKVRRILDYNISQRAIRGGEARVKKT